MKGSELEATVLVVDDEEDILLSLKMLLKKKVKRIFTESNPYHIPRLLRQHKPDLVLLDMNFRKGATQGKEGLSWLAKIKELNNDTQVIVITAHGDIDIAVSALKQGAADFIEKPWRNEKLLATVQSALKISQSQKEIRQLQNTRQILKDQLNQLSGEMIGQSASMQKVYNSIDKVAVTDANVLILGENGTGKEMVARAIHQKSARSKEVFIKVDLGAIPESLFESEMFGHRKGAFTDAKEDRVGRFQAAHGGTLFLDEIGNLSLTSQAKLLSVIQNRYVIPVGSNDPVSIDIRLICATNMPLAEMVNNQTFRQDLLYRINTVEIKVPPLRERIGDISLLSTYFLEQFSRKYNRTGMRISNEGMKQLELHDWKGNIRELRHLLERAVIMTDKQELTPDDFSFNLKHKESNDIDNNPLNIEKMERKLVLRALQLHKGNITKAAEELGLTRAALYRRLEKFNLQ